MELPRYPQIWQCVGMIVGVYGVGYLVAAREPFRHWPIVLVGLLGKVFGPIGFLSAAASGDLPWAWGVTILGNDLIWWLPFTAILYGAFRAGTGTASNSGSLDHQTSVVTSGGELRMLELILLLQAASTLAMVGLIWFVQIVHYPLFAQVGREGFSGYEQAHQNRTTFVVAPLMLVEGNYRVAPALVPARRSDAASRYRRRGIARPRVGFDHLLASTGSRPARKLV